LEEKKRKNCRGIKGGPPCMLEKGLHVKKKKRGKRRSKIAGSQTGPK